MTARSGRGSRNKGRRWEGQVCRFLHTVWPRARVTPVGVPGPDLVDTGDVAVECKSADTIRLPEWCRQAEDQAASRPWLLVVKRKGYPEVDDAYAVLPMWFVAELLREWTS